MYINYSENNQNVTNLTQYVKFNKYKIIAQKNDLYLDINFLILVITEDKKCKYAGGDCRWISEGCKGGDFKSGLCAGPYNRRCCLPDSKYSHIK